MITAELDKAAVDQLYNGWTNYQTWNVALWISNDATLNSIAAKCENFTAFKKFLKTVNVLCTPDGVYYADQKVDTVNINKNFWWLARK